ncbi:Probable tyrosine-protein kinase DDB_G0283397 [Geodia barretti]|nr:Probable tyrosine-protein kinase DDB_G0283397 [Geodia barretti]
MAEADSSDVEDGGMATHVLQEFLLGDVEVCGRELGVGSYSSVLEMKYKGMRCAGKKIHRSLYDQGAAVGPEILERYEKECELLSHLRHPCIVQFLGLYLDDGEDVPILMMEYLSCALSDCIDMHGVLASEISYTILHDVALGLRYLHDHAPPIIHRDLTANNILLSSSMRAKISDLGMAKILNLAPAQMTHRMTVCPGTISYMPPEALIAEPLYDTKLDCFSYGVLMLHMFCGEWPIALEYLQPDTTHPGRYVPLTEIERRDKYLRSIGHTHPLMPLIRRCLRNLPAERPGVAEILNELSTMVSRYPPVFGNHVEMLERMHHDEAEIDQLRLEVDQLRKLLHEKEHEVENLRFTTAGEIETLREQIVCLENSRVLQEAQVLELQSESKRMQLSVREMERELAEARSRIEQLSEELEAATSSAQEQGQESLTRLRRLQNELTSSSKEREAVLKK